MTELRTAKHHVTGADIWEIWEDGRMIGAVYPFEGGVKIVSPYIENWPMLTSVDPGSRRDGFLPALHIRLIGPNARAIARQRGEKEGL